MSVRAQRFALKSHLKLFGHPGLSIEQVMRQWYSGVKQDAVAQSATRPRSRVRAGIPKY
jgi:hypothetical protein